jgi:hypothetical protein
MPATIIAIIITIACNAALIIKNRGIPPSLSHSFYVLGGKPKGYIFYAYLTAMFLLLIVPMTEITPEKWQLMPFIALSSLCFVGVAADFLNEKTIHFTAAAISAVFSIAWCIAVGCWHIALGAVVFFGILEIIDTKSRIYWLETACFAAVFITLINLLQ